MRLTAEDLYDLKVIDKIIKEPKEDMFKKVSNSLRKEIKTTINKMSKMSKEEIVEDRYTKFRNMGEYIKIEKI